MRSSIGDTGEGSPRRRGGRGEEHERAARGAPPFFYPQSLTYPASCNYNVIMRAKLVPIGNSRGIRLPKAILQAAGLKDSVDLRVEEGQLIVTPARRSRVPRAGWAEAIRAEVAQSGPAPAVDTDWESFPNDWDEEGWQW